MSDGAGCAVVIGASSGFGRAAATALSARGTPVAMAARNADALAGAADRVRERGGDVLACVADATREEDVDRLVEEAAGRYGRIDVLVNAAGAPPLLARLDEGLSWASWLRHVDVDVRATFNGCRRVLPLMLAQRGGTIVNVSSGAVIAATPHHAAYTPAKLAVVGLSRTVAAEGREAGVSVHCLCPDITPDGEVGRAAIETFARARGVAPEEWLQQFGPSPPSSATAVGEAVVALLGRPSGVWHVGGAGLAAWELLTPPPGRS